MSSISVVTSCSASGWNEYGHAFVRSFEEFWPLEVDYYLVSEDRGQLPIGGGRCRVIDLLECRDADRFLRRHRDDKRASGHERLPTDVGWTPNKIAAGYNFRYDAFRFAKKVFAIAQVAQIVGHGRLFWVDADVVTFAPVPVALLERLLPESTALCCLDRGAYHSECGFVGYRLDHPRAREFIAAFAGLYASDEVFGLQEWHDSWVFDWLRRKMKVPSVAIPHRDRRHPFVNSELGQYMDHKKGARKQAGTRRSELRINRDVPYWRGVA